MKSYLLQFREIDESNLRIIQFDKIPGMKENFISANQIDQRGFVLKIEVMRGYAKRRD